MANEPKNLTDDQRRALLLAGNRKDVRDMISQLSDHIQTDYEAKRKSTKGFFTRLFAPKAKSRTHQAERIQNAVNDLKTADKANENVLEKLYELAKVVREVKGEVEKEGSRFHSGMMALCEKLEREIKPIIDKMQAPGLADYMDSKKKPNKPS